MHSRIGRGLVPGLAVLLGAAGCSGPRLYPVTGKVTFPDGTPFTSGGGLVYFSPVDPVASPAGAVGEVKPDGTFKLRSNGIGNGAYPGRYVAHLAFPDAPEDPSRPPEPPVERRFLDPKTSGLEFSVKPEPNEFTITVEKNRRAKK